MEQRNQSMVVTCFILKGISDIPELQAPIFLLVLLMYLITLGGNITMLLLVCLDPQLHTPMYFYLANLSFIDISSTTTNLHKIFTSFLLGDNTISFLGCMTQISIYSWLTIDQLWILTVMSYDRYFAICNPLHYNMIMSHRTCVQLATICYVWGIVETIPYLVMLTRVSCYTSNIINHYFCDLPPLLKLFCVSRFLELYAVIEGGTIGSFVPCILTTIPYVFIINTILKIRCVTGKYKAFYTCSSHLTIVILLYVMLICQYLAPSSPNSSINKLYSLFNTAAVPVLNPLIYSLKNKEVKSAFRRRLTWLTT